MSETTSTTPATTTPATIRHCSFCGKTQDEVAKLIAGPVNTHICNECIDLCKEIVDESNGKAVRVTADPVSEEERYRLAEFRLACFNALQGFGSPDANGRRVPWTFGQQREQADVLAAWALDPAPLLARVPGKHQRETVRVMVAGDLEPNGAAS